VGNDSSGLSKKYLSLLKNLMSSKRFTRRFCLFSSAVIGTTMFSGDGGGGCGEFKCFFFIASSSTRSPLSAAGAGVDLTSAREEACVDTAENHGSVLCILNRLLMNYLLRLHWGLCDILHLLRGCRVRVYVNYLLLELLHFGTGSRPGMAAEVLGAAAAAVQPGNPSIGSRISHLNNF